MLVSYPALFYFSPSEDNSYFVYFPDLEGGTQGDSVEEAIFMAEDYLGLCISDIVESGEIPPRKSDINSLSIIDDFPFKDDEEFDDFYDMENSFISLVCVDLEEYFESQTLVKKTLTIPKWSNDLGNKLDLNFSKVLTDAIQEKVLK